MTETALKLGSVAIGMALGVAIVAHVFWHQIRYAYHGVCVLFQFRSHPSNRLAFCLVATLGCWAMIGLAFLTGMFIAAEFDYVSYWLIPIGLFCWLNGAIVLTVACGMLIKAPDPKTRAEKTEDLKLWRQMSDALRLRLGKPLKNRNPRQQHS